MTSSVVKQMWILDSFLLPMFGCSSHVYYFMQLIFAKTVPNGEQYITTTNVQSHEVFRCKEKDIALHSWCERSDLI